MQSMNKMYLKNAKTVTNGKSSMSRVSPCLLSFKQHYEQARTATRGTTSP